jgi:putative two-component system response regulator
VSKERNKIILVDDTKTSLDMGRNLLKTFYEVYPATSAEKMFEILKNVSPDLILLDIEMPEINGYEAIKRLKNDDRYADIPVIFLTAHDDEESELEGFDLGATDYVPKPFSGPLLLKRIEKEILLVRQRKDLLQNQEMLKNYAENLTKMVQEKTEEISELQNTVLGTVTDMVEFRDQLTGGHILRTKLYLKALLDQMKSAGVYAEDIFSWDEEAFLSSAQLHDVGKIAIPDNILGKPGKLTPEEFEVMKTHVTVGVDAIERIMGKTREHAFLQHALHIVGTHHEKWDGSGYPIGLKGKNIPLEGRLMAIADVYDALVMARPYKHALSPEEARNIIHEGSGKHFEPQLVDAFLSVDSIFREIMTKEESENP